jgi:hypothetical protein
LYISIIPDYDPRLGPCEREREREREREKALEMENSPSQRGVLRDPVTK